MKKKTKLKTLQIHFYNNRPNLQKNFLFQKHSHTFPYPKTINTQPKLSTNSTF